MNIFVVDKNPQIAAISLCNVHVIKMCDETCNLLLWPFKNFGLTMPRVKAEDRPRRLSHLNHPCAIWVRASEGNFLWAFEHLKALCAEYTRRYGKVHFAETVIEYINQNYLTIQHTLPKIGLTPFARCFGDMTEALNNPANNSDTITDYRRFYWGDKKDFALWPSLNHIPDWWNDRSVKFIDPSFINGVKTKRTKKS